MGGTLCEFFEYNEAKFTRSYFRWITCARRGCPVLFKADHIDPSLESSSIAMGGILRKFFEYCEAKSQAHTSDG